MMDVGFQYHMQVLTLLSLLSKIETVLGWKNVHIQVNSLNGMESIWEFKIGLFFLIVVTSHWNIMFLYSYFLL